MIKSLEIVNQKNEHTRIMLSNPSGSGFLVNNIDGIDAPKSSINMIERTRFDGCIYNGSRSNARNIVINLELFENNNNGDSIEALRHKAYKMCPVGEKVDLIVTTDNRQVFFNGFVETNETNIFSEKESTTISILCENAYGQGRNTLVDHFSGITPRFEFPFSNESLMTPLIEFGNLFTVYSKMVSVKSEVKTGFVMSINFKEGVNGVIVNNMTTGQSMKINGSFVNGDILTVNTILGQKAVKKNGNNIIGDFFNNSGNDWVEVLPGDNYIAIRDGSGADSMSDSIVSFEYPFLYMGV